MADNNLSSEGAPLVIEAVYLTGRFMPRRPLPLPNGTLISVILDLPGFGATRAEAVLRENGLHLNSPLDLPDGTIVYLKLIVQVSLLVTLPPTQAPPAPVISPSQAPVSPVARPAPWRDYLQSFRATLGRPLGRNRLLATFTGVEALVLGLAVLVYLLVRLVGLTSFPIYFFTDEAILVNSAQELLDNGLRTASGTLLPTFMRNADRWNLGLPVYIQLVSLALFGKSVVVARATSVLVGLLGVLAVAVALKIVFHNRFWWSAVLVMAVIPAWFIHSRTAFDLVMMVAFYACFLLSYLLYRCHSPRYLYAALVFAAAASYGYPNGQTVILVSGLLLLLSDFPYHLRQSPRLLLGAALLAGLLLLPLVRFRLEQPGAWEGQLWVINSYVVQPIPLSEKLRRFADLYAQGLNPAYWFFPNEQDWVRHRWYDLGHLGQYLLPLIVVGLGSSLWRWRSPAYRAVLIAVIAAPAGAVLFRLEVTRALAMVVPAAMLAVIGLQQIFDWLGRVRRPAPFMPFAVAVAGSLGLLSLVMLYTALVKGPTWYSDYGLYGQQYGAIQVFPAIAEELREPETRRVIVSPDWANNPNAFVPFFLPRDMHSRVTFLSPEGYLTSKIDLSDDTLYVLPSPDYELVRASEKLVVRPPERVLPYPNGRPGFYFVRMRYSDRIDAILKAEREERAKLMEGSAVIDGVTVPVRHSRLDLGSVADLFDNDRRTLVRGFEANPLVFEFEFPEARQIQEIGVDFWRVDLQLSVTVVAAGTEGPQTFTTVYRDLPQDPRVTFALPNGPALVNSLRIELLDVRARGRAKIHVTDLLLR